MHPTICQIGPFTIYSYGLTLVAAFLVSSTLARQEAQRQQISVHIIFNLAFIVFISGVIGARFLYIIENITYYINNPFEIIMLQRGGLSWFGGLLSGIIFGSAYLKKHKLPIYRTLDLIAPFLALGQAIGRIGCFLNGCCFGMVFGFLPVQICSSLMLIFIFLILRFLQVRPHKNGQIFFSYLVLYSFKRFFIEFWRQDNAVVFLGLTFFQVLSILTFIVSGGALLFLKRSNARIHD